MFQNIAKLTYKTSLMTCSCLCAASFAAQAAEMQCLNVDCESLGYTKVTDLGSTPCKTFLTCPYDPSYLKCDLLPTCENMGFTNIDKSAWCTDLVRCPTDPSYTLCRSLCGECQRGTALNPADLSCTDGYEPSYHWELKRVPGRPGTRVRVLDTNNCGYTCYKCATCDDEEYNEAEEECPEGTYIVEVRYPNCPDNTSKGERYICAPCPTGLTNSGKNNYDCMTTNENGGPVPNCDNANGYYNKCQTGWEACHEVHTEFGTCYIDADKCGEGTLTEANGVYMTRPSITGHRITVIKDSFENTCYQLTCTWDTEMGCRKAFSEYGTYGAKCIKDKYTCFIFDGCNEGYEWSASSSACVCNPSTHPYSVDNIPDYSTPIEDEKCWDGSEYIYKDFKCDDNSHVKENDKCLCQDIYSISEHDIPDHATGLDSCTDSDGDTFYKSWECDDPYVSDGTTCTCDPTLGLTEDTDGSCKSCENFGYISASNRDASTYTYGRKIVTIGSYNVTCYEITGCVDNNYKLDGDGNCVKKTCAELGYKYFSSPLIASSQQYELTDPLVTGSDGACYQPTAIVYCDKSKGFVEQKGKCVCQGEYVSYQGGCAMKYDLPVTVHLSTELVDSTVGTTTGHGCNYSDINKACAVGGYTYQVELYSKGGTEIQTGSTASNSSAVAGSSSGISLNQDNVNVMTIYVPYPDTFDDIQPITAQAWIKGNIGNCHQSDFVGWASAPSCTNVKEYNNYEGARFSGTRQITDRTCANYECDIVLQQNQY